MADSSLATAEPDNLTAAGGRLCLGFANTVAVHDGTSEYDDVATFKDLVGWLSAAGAISAARAAAYVRRAKRDPAAADRTVAVAHDLRRALYAVFDAAINGRDLPGGALRRLNDLLARASAGAALVARGGGVALERPPPNDDPPTMLWPVVRSAADLLVSDDLARVARCNGRGCTWLFVDVTKNRSRRYCTSAGCGNRARVRRFYHAHRG
jgi:predicted RNA-binding Zn ribbon-like protein